MKRCIFFLLVFSLVFLLPCWSQSPSPDPAAMTDEEILAELDLHQAWTEGALATIEADKEDREALRSDVRYLIDLNLKQASDVNEVLTWLTNSGSENLETLLRQALRWHWPEFWTGVGAGAAVIVIGGLLVPRLFGGD